MSEHNALSHLIRRGRLRQVRNLLLEQASFAAVLALAGAVLLLLLGTQILNWYWLVILFAGSLAVGAYRARTRVLSPYQVAQSMDRHLDFHDSLSTAFYFQEHTDRVLSPAEFVDHQRQSAENLARSADLRRGVPFLAPRTFYINLALALLVCALFGLRFGINRSMELRTSLVPIPFDGFLGPSKEVADAKKGQRPFDGDGHRENGMPVDPWQSKQGDLDPAPDSALQTVDTPEVNNPDGGADAKAQSKATGTEEQTPGQDPLESADKGDSSQAGNDSQGDQNNTPDGQQSGKQQSPKNASQSSNSGENSSLTDKMRDALANLMAKLKMQPKNSDGKQGGSSSQNSQQQAQKQAGQSQDPNASSQQQSDANAQSQGQQQSASAQQQAAQGKSDGKSSDKSNSQEGKSGIGKQDGDKTAREAAQLAAMGKISEIIGKRTANVSGEVMVEVASGKQQLRTQYTQRKAAHGEAGGEINRDEVPLAYQQYVQQYFEEIRKLPASKTKSDPKTKTPGN
ncbi:MAG TPA: hypothetical protein VGV35_12860 [Bryobacteraceae bacterium]|nr:hypothetical protein [Bryobacteraceae bacterium]